VLEIGLGQGADSMQLINRGAKYYGIDLTEESVRRVKERFELYDKSYAKVQVANALNIPYEDDFFDLVYSHGVIHHVPDIKDIVDEIYRVLKPGGKAVVMLYHKNSFNYYISISIIRRIGLFFFPFLSKIIAKITGEDIERINKHILNLKKQGIRYFKIDNFIHKSTDGPDNVFTSVWTNNSAKKLFGKFAQFSTKVYFLNERHLLGFQLILPKAIKNLLARKFGWHLWIFVERKK
jgi:ubiquinone/menaquinone biosynthesis C-methylase UbiE